MPGSFLKLGGLLLLATVVSACTATRPTAEWRSQEYRGGAFNNILIVGVSDREAARRSFEEAFINTLQKEKIRAIPSESMMPVNTKITKESLQPVIEANNIDAVLVTHLVRVKQQQVYNPPRYTPTTYPTGGLYRYHGHITICL